MNLFYTPEITGKAWMLTEEESKHVAKVLRLQNGDTLHLTDGRGGLYTAIILDNHPKRCVLSITGHIAEYGKRNYSVQIGIAPTKNIDRFELFLEKSTEIGIDHIFPIICDRSERKIIKPDRLNRVITAAMKQSLKAYHPVLHDQLSFSNFLKEELPVARFIAHCGSETKQSLKSLTEKGQNCIILIGPEGDFTDSEIEKAIEQDFIPVNLGDSRLRTETAGIVAVHTVALANQ